MRRALSVCVLFVGLTAGCGSARPPDAPPVRVDPRAELNATDPVELAQAQCAIAGKRAATTIRADGSSAFTCIE